MDDDFGDFTGFSQANSNSSQAGHYSSDDSNWANHSSKGSTAASFPNQDGNGALSNATFTIGALKEDTSTSQSSGFANFTQFDVNMADFDIPPPTSPQDVNVHMAGGVPFEIPPLPDSCSFDDFSPILEKENPIGLGGSHTNADSIPAIPDPITHTHSHDENTVGSSKPQPDQTQPINAFGDFSSSNPLSTAGIETAASEVPFQVPKLDTSQKEAFSVSTNNDEEGNSGWTADFGNFSIPPPIDRSPSLEDSAESKVSNISELKLEPTTTYTRVVPEPNTNKSPEFSMFESAAIKNEKILPANGEARTEMFGDFSNFENFANFETQSEAVVAMPPASEVTNANDIDPNVNTSTVSPKPEDDFGAFSQVTPHDMPSFPAFQGDNGFADFTSDESKNKATTTESANEAFSNTQVTSVEPPSFPAFQDNTLNITSTENDKKEESHQTGLVTSNFEGFSVDKSSNNFTGLSGNEVPESTQSIQDDFGDFSTAQSIESFSAHVTISEKGSSEPVKDDFGDFSTSHSEGGFGAFESSSDKHTTSKDNFGDFSGFSGTGDGFGDFKSSLANKDTSDDFGDFSGGDNSEFGGFSSVSPPNTAPSTAIIKHQAQDISSILVSCFAVTDTLTGDHPPTSNFHSLLMTSKTQGSTDQSVWQSLQRCIDFTIPLYKWDNSSLQDHFYSALKVDPMLISRPSTLSVLTGHTKFEDPLGGVTAAEDLMESFGFEGELEQSRQGPISPPLMTGVQRVSEDRSTPTLLDLSLPETPGSPTGHNSFTLTEDLLGLDLNPQPQSQQLTSIQELLRNERLVVNKSKWVDSKLEEFGEGEVEQTNSQPSTPHTAKRQNTVELQLQQLGLDANKVSSFTGGSRELSLAARTVLGRLPELSFMLTSDRVVHTQQYSI